MRDKEIELKTSRRTGSWLPWVFLLVAPGCAGTDGERTGPPSIVPPSFGPPEVIAADRSEPRKIAVLDGRVYWVERGKIVAAESAGVADPIELAIIAGPEQMEGIAVSGGFAYCTNASDANGQVVRVPLAGGATEVLHQGAALVPQSIVAGASGVHFATQSGGGGVWRVGPDPAHTVTRLVDFVFASALAVDASGNVFVATNGGQIGVLSTDLPTELLILRDEGMTTIGGLAVQDGVVFYTVEGTGPTFTDGAVRSFALGDPAPAPVTLATGLHRAGAIVVNDEGIWITAAGRSDESGNFVRSAGTVWWLPLGGEIAPRAVAEGQDHPTALAVDADGVYWTNLLGGTVMRAARLSQ